jgi:predicted CoA-binding protein
MNPLIDDFIRSKTLAVIGLSRTAGKFGNITCKELISRGYEIYPVHREAREIDGIACYPDLASVAGKADALWISIPPSGVPPVLKEAARLGMGKIWLQQGSWSAEVQHSIDELGIPVITKKCILMYAPPVKGFHKFHRTLKSIFGGL